MCMCVPKHLSPWSPLPRVALEQIQLRNSYHTTYIHRENWPLLIKSISCPVLVQRYNHISQRSARRQLEQFQLEGVSGGSERWSEPQLDHLGSAESEVVCLKAVSTVKQYLLITRVVFGHIPLICHIWLPPHTPCIITLLLASTNNALL